MRGLPRLLAVLACMTLPVLRAESSSSSSISPTASSHPDTTASTATQQAEIGVGSTESALSISLEESSTSTSVPPSSTSSHSPSDSPAAPSSELPTSSAAAAAPTSLYESAPLSIVTPTLQASSSETVLVFSPVETTATVDPTPELPTEFLSFQEWRAKQALLTEWAPPPSTKKRRGKGMRQVREATFDGDGADLGSLFSDSAEGENGEGVYEEGTDPLLLRIENREKTLQEDDASDYEGGEASGKKVTSNDSTRPTPSSRTSKPFPPANTKLDRPSSPGSLSSPIQPVPHVGTGDTLLDPLLSLKDRSNFANIDCNAMIHRSSRLSKSASSILIEKKDRYMLTPCSVENKFVELELCDEIQIDSIVLANFEFFSSMFKGVEVKVSKKYPGKKEDWIQLGVFRARNMRGLQVFRAPPLPSFYRYVRIDFHTHYGAEYYCPVSLLRIYGITAEEAFRTWEEETNKVEARVRAQVEGRTENDDESEEDDEEDDEGDMEGIFVDPVREEKEAVGSIANEEGSPNATAVPASSSGAAPMQDDFPEGSPVDKVVVDAVTSSTVSSDSPAVFDNSTRQEVNESILEELTNVTTSLSTSANASQVSAPHVAASISPSATEESLPPAQIPTNGATQPAVSPASSLSTVEPAMPSPEANSPAASATTQAGSERPTNPKHTTPVISNIATSTFDPPPSPARIGTSGAVEAAESTLAESASSLTVVEVDPVPIASPTTSSSPTLSAAGSSTVIASSSASPQTSASSPAPAITSDSTQLSSNQASSTSASTDASASSSSSAPSPSTPSASRRANESHTPVAAPSRIILPPAQVPQPGDSIYGTIVKRIISLELDLALSVKYVEEMGRGVREGVARIERKMNDVENLKHEHDQLIRQALFQLEKHSQSVDRERIALSSQVELLAQELLFEKRLGVAQLIGLLALFLFVGVTRGSPTTPFIHLAQTQPFRRRRKLSEEEEESAKEELRRREDGIRRGASESASDGLRKTLETRRSSTKRSAPRRHYAKSTAPPRAWTPPPARHASFAPFEDTFNVGVSGAHSGRSVDFSLAKRRKSNKPGTSPRSKSPLMDDLNHGLLIDTGGDPSSRSIAWKSERPHWVTRPSAAEEADGEHTVDDSNDGFLSTTSAPGEPDADDHGYRTLSASEGEDALPTMASSLGSHADTRRYSHQTEVGKQPLPSPKLSSQDASAKSQDVLPAPPTAPPVTGEKTKERNGENGISELSSS